MPAPASPFALSVTLGEDSFSASGKHDLVLKAFQDFKALTGHGDDAVPAEPKKGTKTGLAANGKGRATKTKRSGDMTLPAFLGRLKMSGGAQIGTAIVAWSAQYDGKDKLTPTEVQALWKQTKYKRPSTLGNVTRDLNKAVSQALLRKEGQRKDLVFYADTYEQEQVEKWATTDEA